jgi:hypothetical protein
MKRPGKRPARFVGLRWALATIAFFWIIGTLPTPAHGATWIDRAVVRITSREHRSAATCTACLSGRGHRRPGYVGPFQFSKAWNKRGVKCAHGVDWRACRTCSEQRFRSGAARYGKRWVRRHWRATCGGLR